MSVLKFLILILVKSIPSEELVILFSTKYRGRFIFVCVFPGLRSFLTYPGLLIFCPFRAKTIIIAVSKAFPRLGEREGGF